MSQVVIYTTDYCPYCHAAKDLLRKKNVAFTEIDVEGDEQKRAWLTKVTGQRTVPQIFINDKPYGGFSDIKTLDDRGELDAILQQG